MLEGGVNQEVCPELDRNNRIFCSLQELTGYLRGKKIINKSALQRTDDKIISSPQMALTKSCLCNSEPLETVQK